MRFEALRRHPYIVIAVLFLFGWTALSWPWLSGAVTIPFDAKAHFQAQLQFLASAIHSGQSPFWTPNVFGGSPQIADPQSLIFSPAIVLALLSAQPSFQMLDAYVLGMLALAGIAVIGFFRDHRWHPAGALVAALAVAFGASASWRLQHIGQVESYALYFITFWLLDRALHRHSIRYGLAAGFCAGLMVVAPNQVAYLACFLLAGQVIDHLLRNRIHPKALKAALRPLSAATVAGAAVVAVPIVLTILFAAQSNRPEIDFAEAAKGSLHPLSLLTAWIADLFGAKDDAVAYWGPASENWAADTLNMTQNMGQLYIGALPALLILTLGLVRGWLWQRDVRFFTLALGAMTLYALGRYTPVFGLMFAHMPGVDAFRRPADATFFMGGLAALIGGYLVHRLAQAEPVLADPRRRRFALAAVGAVFVVALAVALWQRHGDVALKPLVSSALWLSVAALGAMALARFGRTAALAASVPLGLLMTADLYANNGPNESTALPSSLYEVLNPNCKNPTLAFLKKRLKEETRGDRRDRVELAGLGFEWPNAGMVHGFDHVLGYNPLRLANYEDATGVPDTVASPDQRTFSPLMPSYHSHLANLFGVRYIASKVPIEIIDHKLRPGDLRLAAITRDGYIYENPNALPRVLVVSDWAQANFAEMNESGQWPQGFDPRRTVLFEAEPDVVPPLAAGRTERTEPVATLKTYENTVIEVEVEAPRASFLVLNDVYHPWWKATVNGETTEILKANVLFRAVRLPAGKSIVRFEFSPIAGAIAEIREKIEGEEDDKAADKDKGG